MFNFSCASDLRFLTTLDIPNTRKDGNPAGAGTEALQSLIRLLHRTCHHCIAQSLPVRETEACYYLTAGTDGGTWNASEVLSSLPSGATYSLVFPKHCECRLDAHPQSTDSGRSVSRLVNSHLSISTCFWAWWRTQPNPKQNETVAPAWLARKYLGGQSLADTSILCVTDNFLFASACVMENF